MLGWEEGARCSFTEVSCINRRGKRFEAQTHTHTQTEAVTESKGKMGATHWQEDSAKLDSPPHVFQCPSSFPHSPLPVSACLCCVIKFLPELASCDQLLVLRNLFYSFTAPNVIQTTPYVRIRLIFCYDIISDPFYPPFPAPYCVNVTTKCFVWCRTQVYGSHRDVLGLVRAHKTLWIMSWDTLCILNQFARSVISIIAGVWHGGQTLSALCSALLKGLAHRKITLESKYWLKRFYVLRTICSPWTMSPGGIRLRRRYDHFPVFSVFPQRLRCFTNFPPGVAPEFPLMFFRVSLLLPLPLNVPASSHLPLRQRGFYTKSDPFLFQSLRQCGFCLKVIKGDSFLIVEHFLVFQLNKQSWL